MNLLLATSEKIDRYEENVIIQNQLDCLLVQSNLVSLSCTDIKVYNEGFVGNLVEDLEHNNQVMVVNTEVLMW